MGIEELVVKHRLERGEIAAAHRRIALVLKGEDFLVAAHRQTSLAVSPGTSGLQLAWRLLSLDHLVGAARAPAIRRTNRYGILDRVTASVCLDVGARFTLPHFSVSSTMNIPSSAGEPRNTVQPRSASRACILASVRTASTSLLRRPMISAGVFLRKPMTNHWLAT